MGVFDHHLHYGAVGPFLLVLYTNTRTHLHADMGDAKHDSGFLYVLEICQKDLNYKWQWWRILPANKHGCKACKFPKRSNKQTNKKISSESKCYVMKEKHSTHLSASKGAHNVLWWATLNFKRTLVQIISLINKFMILSIKYQKIVIKQVHYKLQGAQCDLFICLVLFNHQSKIS